MLFRTARFFTGTALALALAACSPGEDTTAQAKPIVVKEIAKYETGIFDESAAEIVAYNKNGGNFFVVNGAGPSIDVLALTTGSDGSAALFLAGKLDLTKDENPTSVAVYGNLAVAAVHKKDAAKTGKVVLFDATTGKRLGEAPTGSLPDMVTFTPDGKYVLTADEGEPGDGVDPAGSISVIDAATMQTTRLGFSGFDTDDLKAKGVRIFPGKTIDVDAEPEYIAISADGKTAWVALQENNAFAVVDLNAMAITAILPLGTKDHSLPGNGFDSNNEENPGDIKPKKVRGLYMPDGIAAYEAGGQTYIISANEGDARDEDERVKKLNLDPNALTPAEMEALGPRLNISTIDGDTDGDGDIDVLYSYGARSFSIWTADGKQIYDSGDDFEQITLKELGPTAFNTTNDENKADNRSDDKGPEPEGVAIGEIDGITYAFIGLERVGGIMMYDVTDPNNPKFVTYIKDRNYSGTLDPKNSQDLKAIGHLGPEGLVFIPAKDNVMGVPMLAVAYEVSGTIGLYTLQ